MSTRAHVAASHEIYYIVSAHKLLLPTSVPPLWKMGLWLLVFNILPNEFPYSVPLSSKSELFLAFNALQAVASPTVYPILEILTITHENAALRSWDAAGYWVRMAFTKLSREHSDVQVNS